MLSPALATAGSDHLHSVYSAPITIDQEDRPERPWLRIESGRKRGLIEAAEAVRIRDGLRRAGGKTEEQLATIIDARATELLAAPLYAGTVNVRIDAQEEECLVALLTSWAAEGGISRRRDRQHLAPLGRAEGRPIGQ